MVTGPNRLSLDSFFKAQATESLEHAQQSGELLTGIVGIHPRKSLRLMKPTNILFKICYLKV